MAAGDRAAVGEEWLKEPGDQRWALWTETWVWGMRKRKKRQEAKVRGLQ